MAVALVVILAAVVDSFSLLLVGLAVLGGGNTAVFLTRDAAAEVGGDAMRGRSLAGFAALSLSTTVVAAMVALAVAFLRQTA